MLKNHSKCNNHYHENFHTYHRGNSKYHYYGIRVKPGSALPSVEESSTTRNVSWTSSTKAGTNGNRGLKRPSDWNDSSVSVSVITQHLSYLGDGRNAIPNFPDITFIGSLPEDCSIEDVDTFK